MTAPKLLTDANLNAEAEAAAAQGDKERLAQLDAEWKRRKHLRRGMGFAARALWFLVLWIAVYYLSSIFLGRNLLAWLNGLSLAVIGTMVVNSVVVAFRKGSA
ncbi:MAG TPA: hypothetical protein VGH80_00555 [Xanthomonadaceae bacterium]